jgi:hypothetical protein
MVGIFVQSGPQNCQASGDKKTAQAVSTFLTHLIRRARNIGANYCVARIF